jgi:galactose mutarotase-like enzyme
VPEPTPSDSTYHPLFNVNQRQHFPEQRSQEFKWVSSSKPVPQVVRTERPEGKQFKPLKFTEDKTHFEKKHNLESCKETTKTWDNPKLTKVTFAHHNKATLKETGLEQIMTQKHRVVTID